MTFSLVSIMVASSPRHAIPGLSMKTSGVDSMTTRTRLLCCSLLKLRAMRLVTMDRVLVCCHRTWSLIEMREAARIARQDKLESSGMWCNGQMEGKLGYPLGSGHADFQMQGTITSYGYADYQCPNCFTLNVYGTSGLQSRGRVNLDSNWVPTPSTDTLYQSNTTDADDIASFIQPILQALNRTNITSLNIPENATQSQIRDYVTASSPYATGFTNHWGGSTRLSESCDTGVVTPNAKVCGMENLYIVDGGMIPTLFTVNPQYGIMVAAEHASSNILADRGDCCGCLGHTSAICPLADSAITSPGASGTASGTSRPSASSSATGLRDHRAGLLLGIYILCLSLAPFLYQ
jgi:hypothetical protein